MASFATYFIAALFALAGVTKALNPKPSIDFLQKSLVMSARLGSIVIRVITALEIVIGVGMLFASTRVIASFVVQLMLFCFLVLAFWLVLKKVPSMPCGCFGNSHNSVSPLAMLARNFGLFLISTAVKTGRWQALLLTTGAILFSLAIVVPNQFASRSRRLPSGEILEF